MSSIRVLAMWDEEVDVFVAHSDDVPGLVVEAASMHELISELKELIPEMLHENGRTVHGTVEFDIQTQKYHGTTHALEA